MGSTTTVPPAPAGRDRLRSAVCVLLDVAALVAAVRLLAPASVAEFLGDDVLESDHARGARTLVILLIVRVLLEVRPARWARDAMCTHRLVLGPRAGRTLGPIRMGAAGGCAYTVALVGAWGCLHPWTDYPAVQVLVLAALVVGLIVGGLAGVLVRLAAPGLQRLGLLACEGAALRLAFILGAGIGAQVAEFDPTQLWAFPTGDSFRHLALMLGWVLFLLVSRAVMSGMIGTKRSRVISAGLTALSALLILMVSPNPLPVGTPAKGNPRAVLFITIDTLRADHLGCHGYERDTSPAIDALADESVLFERAYAAMPTTDPSHVAMLTGRHPRTTGVMANTLPITQPGVRTLADGFLAHGYRTGAITSRAHLNPDALRLSGFQTYSAPTDRQRTSEAAHALRRAETWLDRHGDAPFFLWVHFWDPHGPYDPPREPERSMFVDRYDGPITRRGKWNATPMGEPYPADLLRYAIGLYDGEIRYVDDHVGQLIRGFRERLGRENVLVIVAADHGETLDEMDASHSYALEHGDYLARQELHVPLLMSWPGRLAQGRRIATPVSSASIAPTIADLLGWRLEADVPSLLPFLDSEPVDADPVFAQRRVFFDPPGECQSVPEFGVIEGGHLLVDSAKRGRVLHDMTDDPRGERNLAPGTPALAERLAGLIREFKLVFPSAPLDPDAVSDDAAQTMQGLGYAR
jgi:arylsulfatase A-like enzyme